MGFRREFRFASITIDDAIARAAVSAFSRYGKGRGHTARLNLADCLVHAVAKSVAAPLLFIGDDFTRTDIASVLDDPHPMIRSIDLLSRLRKRFLQARHEAAQRRIIV